MQVMVLKALQPDDWNRFNTYAPRIRYLHMDQIEDRLTMSLDDARLLSQAPRSQDEHSTSSLIPNISHLDFIIHGALEALLLPLLTGPYLRHLSLGWWPSDESPKQVLDAMAPCVLGIRSLKLHFGRHVEGVRSCDLVKLMPGLTALVVGGEHGEVSELLQSLAGATQLSALTVTSITPAGRRNGKASLGKEAFKTLHTVDACYNSISSILAYPSASSLRSLTVRVKTSRDELPAAMSTLFQDLGRSCFLLSSLTIYALAAEDLVTPGICHIATTAPSTISIAPLLSLTNLDIIHIYDRSNTMVPCWEKDDISRMEASWNRLSSFRWMSRVTKSPIVIPMLFAFAGCECLRYLSLPIDACQSLRDKAPIKINGRLVLGVSDWIISPQLVATIAECILRLYENITCYRCLVSYSLAGEDGRFAWDEIKRQMKVFMDDKHHCIETSEAMLPFPNGPPLY